MNPRAPYSDRTQPTARQLIRALRPTHWPRNLLVFGAPAAAGEQLLGALAARELLMALSLTAMASAGYLLNDVHDREEDARHPRKRLRPVAAGTVSVFLATRMAAGLTVIALALALPLGLSSVGVLVLYGLVSIGYTFVFRGLPGLDVAVIAVCYLLRTIAGAVVADVPMRSTFVAVATLVAVFVTAGKRYSELLRTAGDGRTSLHKQHPTLLVTVSGISAAAASILYVEWALQRGLDGVDTLLYASAPVFVLVLLRYGASILAHRAESPEAVVRRDRLLQSLALAWVLLVGLWVLLR